MNSKRGLVQAMPDLTVLSPILPSPPLVGGTAHIAAALQQLRRAYRIQLFALVADTSAPIWPPLAQWCEHVATFERSARPAWGLEPPAVHQERSAALMAHLQRVWEQTPPDIVQLEFTSMAQYAPLARQAGAFVVCTAHNVAFVAQVRRARQEQRMALRARRWLGALSLWRYELRALPQCDLVITLSQGEAVALRRWLPRLSVEYVPSGVNLEERRVCFDPQATDEVLFVGSYQHPPNVEGALWLAREVWPLVRRIRPNARLTLAGRAPPPLIQSLASADIRVPGTLADLQPLYARASLMVAPIFWGSGVRIKILDALAYGLPLVTTALAAEGIDLRHQQSALFAERPQDFANAIVRLLDDAALRARLGAAGRAIVERDYDWDKIGTRLVALYEQARRKL
jgi:glycosyltransferase involved in cell wall biosynthesis